MPRQTGCRLSDFTPYFYDLIHVLIRSNPPPLAGLGQAGLPDRTRTRLAQFLLDRTRLDEIGLGQIRTGRDNETAGRMPYVRTSDRSTLSCSTTT